jgi:TRAP-type C4-dicarboxylate transport system substrate-binding protein
MVRQKEDTMGRKERGLIALTALMLAISACTADSASKAGGDEPPLVLTMGTNDYPGRPAADQIEHFADRVAELSDGSVRVEPRWEVGGRNTPDWDQVVARSVISGELDMGNIPSRAWDTEGVTSLRVLNAPFLITTDGLLDEVVSSDLADQMLSGLDETGVVGLGLVPEGLRHPFGFAAPLLGPEDYDGAVIRSPTSATAEAMFRALGATVTDEQADAETQAGMESGYQLDPDGAGTRNVVFYPKVNTLVINADVFDRLDDEQRGYLELAAQETRQWAIENRVADGEQAAAFCEDGGSVVVADQGALTALEEAVAPVYAELETDAQTRELIASIRQMKQNVPVAASTPTACGDAEPAGGGVEADDSGTAEISAINGVYRLDLSEERMRAGGVPEDQIQGNAGIWTNTMENGVYSDEGGVVGIYEINGNLVTINFEDGGSATYRWGHNANGDLLLEVVETLPEWEAYDAVWTAEPWVRVGDVESEEFPQGSFRVEHTVESLVAQGVDQVNAHNHRGLWTMTFDDGVLSATDTTAGFTCYGSYPITDGRVSIEFDGTGAEECQALALFTATWSFDGDELRFNDLISDAGGSDDQVLLEAIYSSKPWVRVD